MKGIILCVGIAALSFMAGDYYHISNCPSLICPSLICEKQDINLSCPGPQIVIQKEKQSLFQKIVLNMEEEKEYIPDVYDCTEFSNELSRRLNDEGWESSVVQSRVDCDSGLIEKQLCLRFDGLHDFIEIDHIYLEATNGEIISPRDYVEYGIGGD